LSVIPSFIVNSISKKKNKTDGFTDRKCSRLCDPWPIKRQLHIFTVTKQQYIHSSLDIVFCLLLHVHDHIENVLKHVLFYVHEVKVMVEKIGLPIRKLLENTLFYLVVGQTKTRKLLLTGLETKHNVTILWHHIMQFFTRKTWGCNIFFNSANKNNLLCSFCICDLLARNAGCC